MSENQIFAKKDYFEIRLESIGGLGANLCGKMLGEMGVRYLDLNSASFSSYGSEKTGTPVKGYIRFCEKEKEIREHSPVVSPDLLVIFHQALLADVSIWKGCTEETTVLIALEAGNLPKEGAQSEKGAQAEEGAQAEGQKASGPSIRLPIKVGNCYGVPAGEIAIETHSRKNVVMLGAMAGVLDFLDIEAVYRICKDTLGTKYPDSLAGNLEGIRRGFEEVKPLNVSVEEQAEGKGGQTTCDGIEAPGGINPYFGNSVANDVSPSRAGYIPLFIKERCINCGLCDSTCPDMVFQFAKGEYRGREMMVNQGLDYYHCKGCLRCVDVCPVNALVRGLEAEHPHKAYFMPNQDLVKTPVYYEKVGPDGYITSESYLTEKRMDGGEV